MLLPIGRNPENQPRAKQQARRHSHAPAQAAWQLARQGIAVTLIEMKPEKMSPAHHSPLFAELVCSNSLRSDRLTNAVGLLKEEMRLMHSLVMEAADLARVPAGGALAVDRETFSGHIT